NLIKVAQNFLREHTSQNTFLYLVGRKGRDFFRRRNANIVGDYINFFSRLDYGNGRDIAQQIVDLYTKAEVDAVYIIYNEFKSVIQQRAVVEKLLPLARQELQESRSQIDYIYEQPPQEIFNRMLPRYVDIQVFRALLESAASEHGARMAA